MGCNYFVLMVLFFSFTAHTGLSPLHLAIKEKRLDDALKIIAFAKENPSEIKVIKGENGVASALIYCAQNNHPQVAKALLDLAQNPSFRTEVLRKTPQASTLCSTQRISETLMLSVFYWNQSSKICCWPQVATSIWKC